MAMPKRQLERVVRLLESAGREVAAVMPSTLALADAVAGDAGASGGNAEGLVLSLGGDAVELSAHRGGAPRLLRHLPVRGPDLTRANGTRAAAVSSLAGEIRRTVAMMPKGPRPDGAAGSADALHLWDGVGLDAQDAYTLARQAGVELRGGSGSGGNGGGGGLRFAGGTIHAAGMTGDAMAPFAPAVALALAGAADARRGRLPPPPPRPAQAPPPRPPQRRGRLRSPPPPPSRCSPSGTTSAPARAS